MIMTLSSKRNVLNLLAAAVLGIAIAPASILAREDIIQKSFQAKPGGSLTMKVDRGMIKITTSDSAEATIEVRREVKRGPDDLLERHKVEITQTGNDILVKAENPGGQKTWSFFGGQQFNVTYLVKIPREFNVNTRTAGGSIKLDMLKGRAECRTAGGNIEIGSVEGAVVAQTSGGSISLERAAKSAELGTAGGNIRVGAAEADLIAKTSGGSIQVKNAAGKCFLETSGGNIRVEDAAGQVEASTSGGSITASLSRTPGGDCSFKTSGGNVNFSLASSAKATIDARTSGGQVRTSFPDDGRKDRSKLHLELNGGGPRIELSTIGGSVTVDKIGS
jgi:hypothetical protein